ncbi:Peptidase aspartic, catalytic [Cucumis melo var. makuwa]|uniref:Peptidase aspartic, catalytic n=1 Tax=Cucumis melo var. makuwa TaxID=1194695 RepID=A0A5A7SNK6_CUCMM|nr:Peptidase aspartic, catalytic [Cucumis melo var. makuwa]TYK23514.1 Peptidase aspartic, catalytic [Cucumis melo var. makuwa]
MDEIREGNSTTRPPLLDGGNYGYWKSRMEAFFMSLDMRSWRAIILGWEHPYEKDETGKVIRKLELEWTSKEDDAAMGNSLAFEGTSKVKISRLQIWTSRFKELQMTKEETIAEFNVRVLDIANESDTLEENMSDSKLVRKVLRSLPSKFNMKVIATEEVEKLKSQLHRHIESQRSSCEANSAVQQRISSSSSSGLYRRKNYEQGEKDYGTSKFEKNGKGIKCHNCEGFGHIQNECATYLKSKKKSLIATFSDEEGYSESDDDEVGMTLISITTIKEKGARIQCLMEENQSFLSSIVTLKAELKEARNQFEELTKSMRMLTNETQKLDDLIDQGRRCVVKRGLGFSGSKAIENEIKIVFIRESSTQNSQAENAKEMNMEDVASPVKVALMSVNNPNSTDWYFDSGCSKHMTGNAAFFSELRECNARSVVFGDGGKGRIIGKGTVNHPGLPYLLDVRLVQGLSTNLISISQLCNQGYHVSFSKDRCNVIDSKNKVCLSGTRLSDNCCHRDLEVNMRNLSKSEEASLWHKRLGHISGTSIAKAAKTEAIVGLLPLPLTHGNAARTVLLGSKSSHHTNPQISPL